MIDKDQQKIDGIAQPLSIILSKTFYCYEQNAHDIMCSIT